jgi:hypothetical protein
MENKYGNLLFKVLTIVFIIAMAACLIVDFVLNKGITWSSYPVLSIIFAWVITTPFLLVKKHKILITLVIVSIAIFPYLYFLSGITPVKGWFFIIGMPVDAATLCISWINYLLFKFVKLNLWHKSAVSLFLYGIVLSTIARYCVANFLGDAFGRLLSLSNIINIISVLAITALLVVLGLKSKPKMTEQ